MPWRTEGVEDEQYPQNARAFRLPHSPAPPVAGAIQQTAGEDIDDRHEKTLCAAGKPPLMVIGGDGDWSRTLAELPPAMNRPPRRGRPGRWR